MSRTHTRITWLLLVALVLVEVTVTPHPAEGETYVSGVISSDTVWDAAGSPYIVVGDVTVAPTANLTVTGGVQVRLDPGTNITVLGGLRVTPSGGMRPSFIANGSQPWGALRASGASAFLVRGADISGSSGGIDIRSTGWFMLVDLTMSNNTVELSLMGSSGRLVNSTVNTSRMSIDPASRLTVVNMLRVYVGGISGPVGGADVQVNDGNRTVYATPGFGGGDPRTDPRGYTPPIPLVDRVYVGPLPIENRSFVNASTPFHTFPMREVDMNTSHVERFLILDPYLLLDKTVSRAVNEIYRPLPVGIRLRAAGANNSTAVTNVTVLDVLPSGVRYVQSSSDRPVWVRQDGPGRTLLQWNISSMNGSGVWNVSYSIYGTTPGPTGIAVIPPSAVNYTSNSTRRSIPMPDVRVEFTESPLSVSLTSPTGIQIWRILSQHYINWTAEGGRPPVRVDIAYRTITSPQYIPIASDRPANGSLLWQVPMTVLGLLTIRAQARDATGNLTNDTATVLVLPGFYVVVTPPSASVPLGSTREFQAQAYDSNFTPIPSDRVLFTWAVTNTNVGKVEPTSGPVTTYTPLDTGSDTLTCLAFYEGSPSAGVAIVTVPPPPAPDVVLISPRAGERYTSPGEINVSWSVDSPAAPFTVDISYSLDGGATFDPLARGLPQNASGTMSYIWDVPDGVSTERAVVSVSVHDRYNTTGEDSSGGFSILSPVGIRYISGSDQVGDVGTRLDGPLVVQVVGESLTPLEGVKVSWWLEEAPNGSTGGRVVPLQTVTDSAGTSRVYFELGNRPGEYSILASLNHTEITPVAFRERAEPGPLAYAYIFPESADLQEGEQVTFTLTLFDGFNNTIPLTEANITWSVSGGIGRVENGVFTADAPGDGNVSAEATYKGVSLRVSAWVKVSGTGMLWVALGLMAALLLLLLFLILLVVRRSSEKGRPGKEGKAPPPAGKGVRKAGGGERSGGSGEVHLAKKEGDGPGEMEERKADARGGATPIAPSHRKRRHPGRSRRRGRRPLRKGGLRRIVSPKK